MDRILSSLSKLDSLVLVDSSYWVLSLFYIDVEVLDISTAISLEMRP